MNKKQFSYFMVTVFTSIFLIAGLSFNVKPIHAESAIQAVQSSQIDINTASYEELQEIYGIGPVIAQRVIDTRPYESVDDLIKVSGIGTVTLQKIKEQGIACVKQKSKELVAGKTVNSITGALDLEKWSIEVRNYRNSIGSEILTVSDSILRVYLDETLTELIGTYTISENETSFTFYPRTLGAKNIVFVTIENRGSSESLPVKLVHGATTPTLLAENVEQYFSGDSVLNIRLVTTKNYNLTAKNIRFYEDKEMTKLLSENMSKSGTSIQSINYIPVYWNWTDGMKDKVYVTTQHRETLPYNLYFESEPMEILLKQ